LIGGRRVSKDDPFSSFIDDILKEFFEMGYISALFPRCNFYIFTRDTLEMVN